MLFKRGGSGGTLMRYFSWFNLESLLTKASALCSQRPLRLRANEPRWLIVHLTSIFRGREKPPEQTSFSLGGTQICSSPPHPPSVELSIWLSYIGEIQTTLAFVVCSPSLFVCTQDDFNQNNPVTGLALTHLAIVLACGRHSEAAD